MHRLDIPLLKVSFYSVHWLIYTYLFHAQMTFRNTLCDTDSFLIRVCLLTSSNTQFFAP